MADDSQLKEEKEEPTVELAPPPPKITYCAST